MVDIRNIIRVYMGYVGRIFTKLKLVWNIKDGRFGVRIVQQLFWVIRGLHERVFVTLSISGWIEGL